ncbi:MAG: hypothetical protein K6E37_04910 [Bacteroidales bacterium]|nr:hypothetical protein [Bacteroidales bacterium]
MDFRFSDDFIEVFDISRDEALRTGWHNIRPDHIMLAILRQRTNGACDALEALGLSAETFKSALDEALFVDEQIPWSERESINMCDASVSLLQVAALEARRCKAGAVAPLHFLLAAVRTPGSRSHDWFADGGIDIRRLVEASGLRWEEYGLAPAPVKEAAAPDPEVLAAAIERRLREGYVPDNPHLS